METLLKKSKNQSIEMCVLCLQAKSDPIKQRKLEFECFPKIFEDFSHSIMMAEKTACLAKSGDINYSHIAPEELKTVEDAVASARSFLEEKRCLLAKASKTSDPPVTVSVLQAERKVTIQSYYKLCVFIIK
jgi:hypothetical protein